MKFVCGGFKGDKSIYEKLGYMYFSHKKIRKLKHLTLHYEIVIKFLNSLYTLTKLRIIS